ncbi:MAG: hypothetical protein HY873_02810 [Chloroflexi bacterium]|nr:hypothetical protein [Chloroflexota bacterium]
MRRITMIAAFVASTILMAATAGVAHAQYPPPDGSVSVVAAQTTAGPGQQVAITATLRDASGDPLANQACVAYVASQPGNTASVSPRDVTTDASGVVRTMLNVGTTPGTIQVEVICGTVAGRVGVVLGAAQPALAPIELPSTGSGPGPDAIGPTALLLLTAGAVLVLLAMRLRRSRRSASLLSPGGAC